MVCPSDLEADPAVLTGVAFVLFDLFDCADTVVWINNFLADLEAYHNPLRLVLRALGKTHADGLWTKKLYARCVFGFVP